MNEKIYDLSENEIIWEEIIESSVGKVWDLAESK